MGNTPDTVTRLSAAQICERLAIERTAAPAAIAFDGDGTLWTGDVGEDLYRAALDANAIRDEAGPALAQVAREHGVEVRGSPTDVAAAIFQAYLADRFPERQVCEVMTWCYAGWTPSELVDFAKRALERANLEARINRRLEPIVRCARETGIRTVVISASPVPVVVAASELWGFTPDDIAASPQAVENGHIVPRMGGLLPYAEAKCVAGRALLGEAEWIASFGDNVFDIDMFAAARFGVAVQPKPKLERALATLSNVVLLA